MKNKYGDVCYKKLTDENGSPFMGYEREALPFYGRVSLANGTCFTIGMFKVDFGPQCGRLFVGIEGVGAYTFSKDTFPSYVESHLNLPESDARSIADFVCAQFDIHRRFQKPEKEFL